MNAVRNGGDAGLVSTTNHGVITTTGDSANAIVAQSIGGGGGNGGFTVNADGTMKFKFHQLEKANIPASISKEYGSEFVNWCFEKNVSEKQAQ